MERIIKVVHSVFFILFFIIEFIFLLIHKIWGLVKLAILFPWIEAYWISIWNKYSVSQEYNKIREKYGRKANPEAYAKFIYIIRAYELAGILLMENMTDPELLFKLYPAGAVTSLWETFSPYIQAQRVLRNTPDRNIAFEHLYNEAKKRYPEARHRDVEYT